MYQHVSRKMRPTGKVRLVPWATLAQVEALQVSLHHAHARDGSHTPTPSVGSPPLWRVAHPTKLGLCPALRLGRLHLPGHVDGQEVLPSHQGRGRPCGGRVDVGDAPLPALATPRQRGLGLRGRLRLRAACRRSGSALGALCEAHDSNGPPTGRPPSRAPPVEQPSSLRIYLPSSRSPLVSPAPFRPPGHYHSRTSRRTHPRALLL